MTIEFSLCIICVNHFSCQEIYLCTFSHALTHNHDAHEVLLVENLQCNTCYTPLTVSEKKAPPVAASMWALDVEVSPL